MNDNVIIRVNNTNSTNNLLRNYNGEKGTLTIATADYQTNGRGQGNNSWESEEGKNILYSILAYPNNLPANRQFVMLEAQALAIKEVMDNLLMPAKCYNDIPDHNDISDHNTPITIKWPNDIYYHDKKLSGTLTECVIKGMRCHSCIIGTGININQTIFRSDAPNPISIKMITGRDYDRETLLQQLIDAFARQLDIINSGDYDCIHYRYIECLYRRQGLHKYMDGTGVISAELNDVTPSGRLRLRTTQGEIREYGFKEVKYI